MLQLDTASLEQTGEPHVGNVCWRSCVALGLLATLKVQGSLKGIVGGGGIEVPLHFLSLSTGSVTLLGGTDSIIRFLAFYFCITT